MRSIDDLEQENELLRQELNATLAALLEERAKPDHDEVVYFLVKVPAQNGWHRWKKESFTTEELAIAAAQDAADHHSRARVVERRSFIRERVLLTLSAASVDRSLEGQDPAEGLGRDDESAVPEGQTPERGNS